MFGQSKAQWMSYDVTLGDLRERKARLEEEIRQSIERFRRDTGVEVESLNVGAVVLQDEDGELTTIQDIEIVLDI